MGNAFGEFHPRKWNKDNILNYPVVPQTMSFENTYIYAYFMFYV